MKLKKKNFVKHHESSSLFEIIVSFFLQIFFFFSGFVQVCSFARDALVPIATCHI